MQKNFAWKQIAVAAILVLGSANVSFAAVSPAAACSAAKHKAIGKYVAGILNCYAKAIAKGELVDGGCIGKIATKTTATFTKLEAGGGCATTADVSALASRAISFIDAVDSSLPTTPFAASCYDGMQNGFETGVDCGGSFCVPCL